VFKQVFRVAFVTLIWKQYKHVIVSTLLLFTFLFLIGSIHSDFLKHAELQNKAADTGLSFIYKWFAFIGAVVIYFFYHFMRNRKLRNHKLNSKTKQQSLVQELDELEGDDDPFAQIRTRKKLRGRADFMIDEKK